MECEVARLGTLRDSSLPRLLHTPGGAWPRSRNLGAGAKLPRAALNFDVVGHMAAESVRMAHSQKLGLARVQSAGNLVWIKVIRRQVATCWTARSLRWMCLGGLEQSRELQGLHGRAHITGGEGGQASPQALQLILCSTLLRVRGVEIRGIYAIPGP